jgi:hypothetical protein
MTQHDAESAKNEDQLEIAEYFASSRYQRAKSTTWQRERMVANIEVGESKSLFMGIGGLATFVFVFGVAMPLGMELVEEAFSPGPPKFALMMIILQTLLYPPVVCFAFATVTPMFWYGSVFLRFAMASFAVLPGCIAFVVVVSIMESGANDFWRDFFAVMFAYFITAAAIALGVQLWSPWTMTHAREGSPVAPPTGTRSMLELTAIAAIGCAVLGSIDLESVLEGVLFFTVFAFLASIAIISLLIIALGEKERKRIAVIVALGAAFVGAVFVNGFFAVMEYGWHALTAEFLLIGAVSMYGVVVIGALMALCLGWLRYCGWTCINRKNQRPRELVEFPDESSAHGRMQ